MSSNAVVGFSSTFPPLLWFFVFVFFPLFNPAEVGGERQESSAHRGAATAGAETPEEASGAAGGGEDPHGQYWLHSVLRQVGL